MNRQRLYRVVSDAFYSDAAQCALQILIPVGMMAIVFLLGAWVGRCEASEPPRFWLTVVESTREEIRDRCGHEVRGCVERRGALCTVWVPRIEDWGHVEAQRVLGHEVRHCIRYANGSTAKAEREHVD